MKQKLFIPQHRAGYQLVLSKNRAKTIPFGDSLDFRSWLLKNLENPNIALVEPID
jgi:hypothetical protein